MFFQSIYSKIGTVQRFLIQPVSFHIISIIHQSVTFIIIDEPTLIQHCHKKSIDYVKVHSWCYTFHVFGQIYNDKSPPLQHQTDQFHYPKNPAFSSYSSFSTLSTLGDIDLSTLSVNFPFPECLMSGKMQCVVFLD